MTAEELKERLENIKVWKQRGERAPHKPLLILLYLGRLVHGEHQMGAYEKVRDDLKELLLEFGPFRKKQNTLDPFVRLCNDGLWKLEGEKELDPRRNWGEKDLLENNICGGFRDDVFELLKRNPRFVNEVAQILLFQNFPESLHEDILAMVGLNLGEKLPLQKEKGRVRDPNFRELVIKAYEYRCAVCGFDVRLGYRPVALEAAHIKWFQVGGPDRIENGVALCTMHHKLFDKGVFTINNEHILQVAEYAHGAHGFNEWLMRYHGKPFREPQNPAYLPENVYLNWHVREVFKGPPRYSLSQ